MAKLPMARVAVGCSIYQNNTEAGVVRLSEISEMERDHILAKELPVYESRPWAEALPQRQLYAAAHRAGPGTGQHCDRRWWRLP